MNKQGCNWLYIGLQTFIILGCFLLGYAATIFYYYPSLEINQISATNKNDVCSEIIDILRPITNRDYVSQTESEQFNTSEYVCRHFAWDSIAELTKRGYESEYCSGTSLLSNSSGTHAWIKVNLYIDPSTGELLSNERYNGFYEVHRCKPHNVSLVFPLEHRTIWSDNLSGLLSQTPPP